MVLILALVQKSEVKNVGPMLGVVAKMPVVLLVIAKPKPKEKENVIKRTIRATSLQVLVQYSGPIASLHAQHGNHTSLQGHLVSMLGQIVLPKRGLVIIKTTILSTGMHARV